MSTTNSLSTQERLGPVTLHAYGQLLLTSVHHAYGAYIYDTPWRLHIVPLSIAAAIVTGAAAATYRRYEASIAGTIAFWILCATTFAFPFGMIGWFEGGYNHLFKNVLHFGGASAELMQAMFPAPTYELPNDIVFEVTGVAQFVPAVAGVLYLSRLVRGWRSPHASLNVRVADQRPNQSPGGSLGE